MKHIEASRAALVKLGDIVDRALGLPNENAERWAELVQHPLGERWAYPVDDRIAKLIDPLRADVPEIPEPAELGADWSPPSHPELEPWRALWEQQYGEAPSDEATRARFPELEIEPAPVAVDGTAVALKDP